MAPEGRIVVYRAYFQRLLKTSMPLRDRLVIELPCLEGLRSGEISTLRAEWIDLENGDIRILDSKKQTMFTLPLDPTVAKHVIQLGIHEGFLIRGRKRTGKGLSVTHVERLWKDYCVDAGIPPMSPRMGRAYFAVIEHFVLRKPIGYIQFMLRHDDLQSTEHYVNCDIVDYGDMKEIFYQGKENRMFQPQIKEEQAWNKK